jgi:hypothetical protein
MIRPFHRRFCPLLLALAALAGCGKVETDTGKNTIIGEQPVDPLPDHPRAELSNLRFGRGVTGREKYSVDWRWTKQGPTGYAMQLIIRSPNRLPIEVPVSTSGKQSGTVSGEIMSNRPEGEEGPSLESACEMYLVVQRKFKVSNSLTSGNASVTPTREPLPREIPPPGHQ